MISLRPYQQRCVDAFYDYYAEYDGHGLIVVPTAGGKSIVIGKLCQDICQRFPDQRILVLSHVRELIEQNHNKVMLCWPNAPAGIYSAALKKRQAHFPIVVASIQSVYKKAVLLGPRDLVFIDEAHLLQSNDSGMYRQLIRELLAINPLTKFCGFTATDYRTDSGHLTEGDNPLFTDVIIEISINELLEDGYLTPPISHGSRIQANMDGVDITAGDYNKKQMGARFDQREFLNAALDYDVPFLQDRKCIAAFCATVENAEHVAEGLTLRGIPCEVLDGEMPQDIREDKLARLRDGRLRALASVNTMTTGTDVPGIDCILMYISTESPGRYQQIIGRGFRVVYLIGADTSTREGRIYAIARGPKPNFLVMDHGGNVERHGAITNVEKPTFREKGQSYYRKKKARICEVCRSPNALDAFTCSVCGMQLVVVRDPTSSLSIEASTADILGTPFTRGEVAQWFAVDDVRYVRHIKPGSHDSLRVTYYCGMTHFDEFVHLERPHGKARQDAVRWWNMRDQGALAPANIKEALDRVKYLNKPAQVQVVKRKNKFYEVLRHDFNELSETRAGIPA